MRTRKAVAGQVAVRAAGPRGLYVHAGCGQFDDLAELETEIERIGFRTFYHRYQRRRKYGRKARLRQVICGGNDDTAGLIRPVQKVVKRRKELRLCRAETKIYHTK